jgi:ABC-type phosphate transport system auxiliary subunit
MATTEHARRRLYQRLNELIGPDEADTLMELLPPTGWADVATRHDLAHQTEIMSARFDRLVADTTARFDRIDARFAQNDARFAQLDDSLEARFGQIDARFAQIDARFAQLDDKIDARVAQLDDRIEARFGQLDDKIDAHAQVAEGRLMTEIAGVRIGLADLRTELHRSLRVNMLVTIGVLGTLITVVGALTSGA